MERYVPGFVARINNGFFAGASAIYRRRFGIGIGEWRVAALLAIEPGIRARRACEYLGMDKSAVSKCLARMLELDLVRYDAPASDERKRSWWLTQRGFDLHDQMLDIALARQDDLLAGIDAGELEAYIHVSRQMLRNLAAMKE